MNNAQRNRFDAILESVLDVLPDRVHELLGEIPLIVEDQPSDDLIRLLAREAGEDEEHALAHMPDELCGLHTGVALTERSVEATPELPDHIQVFRRGIVSMAGGWTGEDGDNDDAIAEEIRITILHEIGHHFGLDEDDLYELGYD